MKYGSDHVTGGRVFAVCERFQRHPFDGVVVVVAETVVILREDVT